MIRRFLATAIAALGLAWPSPTPAQGAAPVVRAPAGELRGELEGAVAVFRGVPYAQPPVGERRWRPAEPLPAWEGVRQATRFGAACMQPPSPFEHHAAMSEDCLFLNVWTPKDARDAPVMVWIHGGSLVSGAGSDAVTDGARLAEQGVVVVSINYRLGALGWLAHPALSAESPQDVSGNYGLTDQVQALRWVHDNIRAFGGDPGKVTIAGQSAGALSVILLMAAPQARGLFEGAIAQSGYMITMPELRNGTFHDWPDAETIGLSWAGKLGATNLTALRSLSAEKIIADTPGTGYFPLAAVDGRILPRQLVDTFDRGEQAPVRVLAGYNDGEIRSLPILLPPAPADAQAYTQEIRARYGDLADAFLERYPASDIRESMLATTRDAMYGWSAERLVKAQAAVGRPAYLYLFDHGYPAADDRGFHAFHGAEIPYVFGTTAMVPGWWPAMPKTAAEQRLSDAMLGYWTSFVKDGRPHVSDEPDWRPYGLERAYMAFEDAPEPRVDPPNGFDFNEAVVCRRRADGHFAWHWNVGVIAPPLPAESLGCVSCCRPTARGHT